MPLARTVLRPLPFHPRPCPGRPVPLRRAYLAALAVLQVAIAVHAAPVLVPPMSRLTAYAAFHGGGAGALLLVLTALAAIGAAIALAFPALALARHLRRGERRFAGVPTAAAALATAGAAVLLVGAVALAARRIPATGMANPRGARRPRGRRGGIRARRRGHARRRTAAPKQGDRVVPRSRESRRAGGRPGDGPTARRRLAAGVLRRPRSRLDAARALR